MDKKKVLILKPLYEQNSPTGCKMLRDKGYELIFNPLLWDYTLEQTIAACGDVDGVIADSEPWCEETLAAAPKLKVIARYGTGMNTVDVDACRRHGVIVTNCPGLNANTVAEHTTALLLSAVKQIPFFDASTRKGQWDRRMSREISDMTIGILGFGNIGQKVARKLSGFGCRLIAYDAFPNSKAAEEIGAKLVPQETIFKESDVICIHVPLLPETEHLISTDNINKMKDGVIIVNTARGPIVDEKAVAAALQSGKIMAFATDVFEKEPIAEDNPLRSMDNYICTPHCAANTYEDYERTGIATAQVIIDTFEGREPKNRRV